MVFTTEQIKELVPEVMDWKNPLTVGDIGDRMDLLVNLLLETRHRLKVARDGLEKIAIDNQHIGSSSWKMQGIARETLEATK